MQLSDDFLNLLAVFELEAVDLLDEECKDLPVLDDGFTDLLHLLL